MTERDLVHFRCSDAMCAATEASNTTTAPSIDDLPVLTCLRSLNTVSRGRSLTTVSSSAAKSSSCLPQCGHVHGKRSAQRPRQQVVD